MSNIAQNRRQDDAPGFSTGEAWGKVCDVLIDRLEQKYHRELLHHLHPDRNQDNRAAEQKRDAQPANSQPAANKTEIQSTHDTASPLFALHVDRGILHLLIADIDDNRLWRWHIHGLRRAIGLLIGLLWVERLLVLWISWWRILLWLYRRGLVRNRMLWLNSWALLYLPLMIPHGSLWRLLWRLLHTSMLSTYS